MNFVIPMAGAGSRFVSAGFALPKPLIPVAGEPMYRWAVSSLNLARTTNLVFILRAGAHAADLRADLEETYRRYAPRVLIVDHLTRGQAETVYLAKELLDPAVGTVVHNADTGFVSGAENWEFGNSDGALLTFHSREERWSYARVDASGRVIEVAEKKVISDHASTGTYYFRDTRLLLDHLSAACAGAGASEGELYIGPLYNNLIRDGAHVTIRDVRQLLCFGTPADLEGTLKLIASRRLTRTDLVHA